MKEPTTELQDVLKYNLSFAGCGFLGIYHVGVAVCFRKYAPHLLLQKISGASAGALAACSLLLDMPLGEMTSDFFRIVNEARSHSLGPFSPSFNIQTCILEGMRKAMPMDAHLRVNGKLHISLTRVYDGKSIIVSQFNSRDDLLQALLCACFIPGFSGFLPPKFHGVRYMDGAFSDNLPTLDENTVTVSPFAGETDICPRDDSAQIFHLNLSNTSIELSTQNVYRFMRILFPPKPEILSNMCQQGFDDALHFLHRNNLISCTRCISIQSTFVLSKQTPDYYDPECTTCTTSRDKLIKERKMPEQVLNVMAKYLEESNNGLVKWFKAPAVFILKTLAMPATIPCDFVYATLTKLIANAPNVSKTVWGLTQFLMQNLHQLFIPRFGSSTDMEYDDKFSSMYDDDPILKHFNHIDHRKSIMSLDTIDSESDFEIRNNMLSRRNSIALSRRSSGIAQPLMTSSIHSTDVDALDQVVNVASHHDTLYSYHYIDETDKTMKFNKIVDVTESDSMLVQASYERELNQMLQFDESDMDMMMLVDNDDDYCDQVPLDALENNVAIIHPESKELFEEDWKFTEIKVDEIVSDPLDDKERHHDLSPVDSNGSIESMDFYKPEADQNGNSNSNNERLLSDDVVIAMRRNNRDYNTLVRSTEE
ncbi:hypothetical protein PVAND_011286 [Polypedilum vanderplanki]|uniref:triacylglycerol lipase n=1 Tax=Polypedilum vanderplanki TaxID=319348 RepID=A0A9J6CJ32_POLVA|nr:hypothetical protein PVAND_011286 [Polypedilum vanderplanki]